jgi:hypothetical protein
MLFPVIAIVVGVLFLTAAAVTFKDLLASRRPPGAEPLPATTLQRLSLWAVLIGVILVSFAAWFLVSRGPVAVFEDDALRLRFTAIILGSLALFGSFFAYIYVALTRQAKLDERDRTILARAPLMQGFLMLLTLAAWTVGLQETFRGTPGVPVTYIQLMFWSCLAASMLAWPIGILIGYRRV